MKRKILTLLLSLSVAVSALGVSSCHVHSYEREVVKAATCSETGEEKLTCTECGKIKTRILAAVGGTHEWSLESVREPECSIIGFETYRCSRCNLTEERNYQTMKHDYDGNICKICGYSKVGSKGLQFKSKNDMYVVSGYTGSDTHVIIPTEYNGKAVFEIAREAFELNQKIEKITIPCTVKTLRYQAFNCCDNLKEIVGGEKISVIEDFVFNACRSLESFNLTDEAESIGIGAFKNCVNLKGNFTLSKIYYLGESAFMGCSKIESVIMSGKNPNIYKDTFNGCTSLKKVQVGENVEDIHERAFMGCVSLKEIDRLESIWKIKALAFANCSSLVNLSLGKDLHEIDAYAFKNCFSLEKVDFDITDNWTLSTHADGSGGTFYNIKDGYEAAQKLKDECEYYWYNAGAENNL